MQIFQSVEGSEIAIIAATWELNPKVTRESLADEFKSNRSKALKNYASIVSHNIEAAIKDPDMLVRAVNTNRSNPWDPARNKFCEWFRGAAGVRYFIHFDLSESQDATGVAMVHREKNGCIIVDFMLRIEVPFGRNINYAYLREEFIYEVTRRGFHIEMVTYDGFNSSETRQILEEKGYHTDKQSVDKTTGPYDTLIELIANTDKNPAARRIDYFDYPRFILEMEELKLVNGTRYDHPKKNKFGAPGSKDVSDAVAGAAHRAIEHSLENPITQQASILVSRVSKNHPFRSSYGERSPF